MGEKHQWSNEEIKCLLETCIEEINSVGKRGLSLHKDSWNKLGRVLKEKFGMDFSQKQLKNAFDNLKAKYIGWMYLKNKTGNIYNSQTNTFSLTNEEWEQFKKGHPKAASLRTSSLPFPDLCAALFDGNAATGNRKCADDLANDMKKALQYLIKGNEGPTVLECSDKLKLVGLDPVDPLFLVAYHIFGVSTGMREAWMALSDLPGVLKGWLAMTAQRNGHARHVNVDDDDEVEAHGTASDREYMNGLRDEIAEQMMQLWND
ncbi:hypothetical protein E3N88_43347 [Mikania micrantha]|uniref:Myb/SANT-like domain-containing protein n=1 Tax=Mikania micrantha TaxID=192012 RepID=A0A5N6LG22_9ASTR|nr:hypothetical protein E3N88_43347 [Mikania micrantha]